MVSFRGVVFSGMGEGSDYVGMEPYQRRIEDAAGFRPFPGTLNLEVDPGDVEELKKESDPRVIESFEYRGKRYSGLELYAVEVGGAEAAFIDIEITDYGEDVMEIVSAQNLRQELELEDGDRVKVSRLASV